MSVIDDNWDYSIDLHHFDNVSYYELKATICNIKELILHELEDSYKLHKFVYNGKVAQSHDDELKDLVEKNRILRNELKETHEAFLMAKKYYKKFLKMYHTVESMNSETQTIFLQYFTEAKRDSQNYSIRLLRNIKTRQYQRESIQHLGFLTARNYKEHCKKQMIYVGPSVL
ncbi:Protein translocase subunit SecA [Operophtera brumata]|uniref:Protein translocase subunit SecA n=1 Tax=Operophtera brumata TaxID=104452 RepID=A0A0L7LPI9_OPEBR|nr:Protein translocase subunit SecA [Operophtera brumata]